MLNAPAYICMEFSVISDLEFKKKNLITKLIRNKLFEVNYFK